MRSCAPDLDIIPVVQGWTVTSYPCVIPDDGSPVSHDGDCVTAPERAGRWPLPGERTYAATS